MARFLVELLINASGEAQVVGVADNIGSAFGRTSKSVDASSLRTESSLRRTTEAAEKLKSQMAETKAAKGLIADMTALNTRLNEQITALKKGPEALARLAQQERESAEAKRILTAQVRAGVSADSAQGKQIAELIRQHNRYQTELDQTKQKEAQRLAQKAGLGTGVGGTDQASALLGGLSSLLGGGGPVLAGAQNLLYFKATLDGVTAGAGGAAGGIGALVASIGPYLPLVAAAAAGTAALGIAFKVFDYLKGVIVEGTETQVMVEQLNATLRSSGSASGLSARGMIDLAESLALLSGGMDDPIIKAETIISRFDKIGEDVFPRVITASVNMARALGKSVEESAQSIARALSGTQGLRGLREAGIVIDPAQKKYLENLLETNRVTEYQNTLLDILERKLGNAAEAFGNTLPGAVGKARFVYGEFRESIASEVIPALEDVLDELVRSAGGWDMIKFVAVEAGKDIGGAIRTLVYGIAISYHEWAAGQDVLAESVLGSFKDVLNGISDFARAMASIPGSQSTAFRVIQLETAKGAVELSKAQKNAGESALEHAGALVRLNIDLASHRRALEGDTKVYGTHGEEIDRLSEKTRKIATALGEWEKALYSLGLKLSEQRQGLITGLADQDKLLAALRDGIIAYEQQMQAQSRAAAVKQALAKADADYRAGLEKLNEIIKKLETEGATGQAAKKRAELEDINRGYADQRKLIGDLAGAEFDRKQEVKSTEGVVREATQADAAYARLQAELKDLLTGTTTATRALAREEAIRIAAERAAKTTDQVGIELAKQRAAADFDRAEAVRALTAAERIRIAGRAEVADTRADVADWTTQREAALRYGETIAGILDQYGLLSDAAHKRSIAARVASAIAAGASEAEARALQRELEGQQAIIDGLHRIQAEMEIRERWYRDFATQFAGELSGIFDQLLDTGEIKISDFSDALKNAFRSTTSAIIEEWLHKWAQAMAAWLVRWIATQAAAKTASAAMGSSTTGGTSALFGMGAQAAGAGAAGGGGAGGGGMLSGVFGGGGAGSSAAVGGLAWMAVFIAAVAVLLNRQKTSGRAEVDTTLKFGGGEGIAIDEEVSRWNRQGGLNRFRNQLKAMEEMIKAVTSFVAAAGGAIDTTLKSTSSITVGREGQGGKTNWFVKYADGLVRHFGKDMEAAMSFAMVQAIKRAPTLGLSPEVAAAIRNSTATGMEQFQKDIDLAMSIVKDRLGSLGADVYDKIKAFYARVEKAAKLGITIDQSILSGQLGAIENQLLGINTAVADFLDSLLSFQAGIEEGGRSMAATIRAKIKEAEDQLADLLASGPRTWETPSGEARTQSNEMWERELQRLRDAIAKYRGELDKIPQALSEQEIRMGVFSALYKYLDGVKKYSADALKYAKQRVDLEFALIKARLIELKLWEEFAAMFNDAYAAALKAAGQTGRSGGRGSGKAESRDTLRDEIGRMRAEAQGALHAAFFDFTQQLKEFGERAKEAKLPAKELAEAVLLMTQKFQEGLRTQADTMAGLGTDFTKRLQGVREFFDELEALGRGKTGMPDWLVRLLEGQALGKLGAELDAAINQFMGLVDPMAAINAQADTLRQNVIAYGEAAGWTAEQIQAALDKVGAGVEFQREQGINSILGTLFGYLQDNAAFAGQELEYKKQGVQLQFAVIRAQLEAYGVLAKYAGLVDAAEKAAIEQAGRQISQPSARDTSFADGLRDAAAKLKEAAERLRSVTDGLAEYQRSLRTDAQLGLVNSREALDNSKALYEVIRGKALGGDVDAMEKFREFAETYKRNVLGFSPSSGLTGDVMRGIDETLSQLIGMNEGELAKSPVVVAIEGVRMAMLDSGSRQRAANEFNALHVANANDATSARDTFTIAQVNADAGRIMAGRQAETNTALSDLRRQMERLSNTVDAWRIESRSHASEVLDAERDAVTELEKINSRADRDPDNRRGKAAA